MNRLLLAGSAILVVAAAVAGRANLTAAAPTLDDARLAPPASTVVMRRLLGEGEFDDFGYPSDDGRRMSGYEPLTGDLVVRDLVAGTARALHVNAADPNAYVETSRISPDGRRIAFALAEGNDVYSIGVVEVESGAVREVFRDSTYWYMEINGFAPDGRHVLVELDRIDGLFDYDILDLDGGPARRLYTGVRWVMGDVFFSADGRWILRNDRKEEAGEPDRDPVIMEVATARSWPLLTWPSDDTPVGFTPDGRGVLIMSDRGGTPGLWLLPIRDGRPDGEPRLLRADIWNADGLGVTRDGRLHYAVHTGESYVYGATLDAETGTVTGEPTRMDERDARRASSLGLSANGEWLAHNVAPGLWQSWGRPILTLRSTLTGETRELRVGLRRIVGDLRWSDDGAHILVAGVDSLLRDGLFSVDVATGRTTPIRLRGGRGRSVPWPVMLGWTRDGRATFIVDRPDSTQLVLARAPRAEHEDTLARRSGAHHLSRNVRLSRDGRWVASMTLVAGDSTVALRIENVAGTQSREIARVRATEAFPAFEWGGDGASIFVVKRDHGAPAAGGARGDDRLRIERVSLADGSTHDVGLRLPGVSGALAVHPDGRHVYALARNRGSELWVMERFLPTSP